MTPRSVCLPLCKVADELAVAACQLFEAALYSLAVDRDLAALVVDQAGGIALFKMALGAVAQMAGSTRGIAAVCAQSVVIPVVLVIHYYQSVLLRHNEHWTVCR